MTAKLKCFIGMLAMLLCASFSITSNASVNSSIELDENGVGVIQADSAKEQGSGVFTYGALKLNMQYDIADELVEVNNATLNLQLDNIDTESVNFPTSIKFHWVDDMYSIRYVDMTQFPSADEIRGALGGHFSDIGASGFGASPPVSGDFNIGDVSCFFYQDSTPADPTRRVFSKSNGALFYIYSSIIYKDWTYTVMYKVEDFLTKSFAEDSLQLYYGTSSTELSSSISSNGYARMSGNGTYYVTSVNCSERSRDFESSVFDISTLASSKLPCLDIQLSGEAYSRDIPKFWLQKGFDSSLLLNQVDDSQIVYLPVLNGWQYNVTWKRDGYDILDKYKGDKLFCFLGEEVDVGRDISHNSGDRKICNTLYLKGLRMVEGYSDGVPRYTDVVTLSEADVEYNNETQTCTFSYDGNIIHTQMLHTSCNVAGSDVDAYKVKSWHTSSALTSETKVELVNEFDSQCVEYDTPFSQIPFSTLYPWFIIDTDVIVDGVTYHVNNITRNAYKMEGATGAVVKSAHHVYTGDFEIPSMITTGWGEKVDILKINSDAFQGATITSVRIPNNIASIPNGTFCNINTLETVYMDSSTLRLSDAFDKDVNLWTYANYNSYKYYVEDGYGEVNGYTGRAYAYNDKIAYECNGGKIDVSDETVVYPMQDGEYVYLLNTRLSLPTPIKPGYKFVGWYDNPSFEGEVLRTIAPNTVYTLGEDGKIHLYAKWQLSAVDVIIPDDSDNPDLDVLNENNKTNVETEAEAQKKTEEEQAKLSEEEARRLAEEKAQQQALEQQQVQREKDNQLSDQNEVVESLTSPDVKLRSVKTKSKKIIVKLRCATKAEGYEIQASTSSQFKKKVTKTLKVDKKNATFKKMKKGKVYYVRARAYVFDSDGNQVYGDWSKVKKVKIKK